MGAIWKKQNKIGVKNNIPVVLLSVVGVLGVLFYALGRHLGVGVSIIHLCVSLSLLFLSPGGWGNSCYLNNFATISLVVLLTIPYFLQKIIFDFIYICYYYYVLIKFISCIDINDVAGNSSIGMHIGLFFSCNQFNVN